MVTTTLKVGMILNEDDFIRLIGEAKQLEGSRKAIFDAILSSPFVTTITLVVIRELNIRT
jgi:hypothetical protein